ncbi:MAG: prolipoprotein diacylglyceryl transferase [Lachnospiraceae bacterium]|nr:prolipoprotein diacylglyceryl transferase [Lachnospiraceae bacterium]
MFPSIHIGSFELPLYGMMFLIGFFLAILMIRRLAPKVGVGKDDALFAAIYGAIGLLIGAKILYFITKLPSIIKYFDIYVKMFKAEGFGALNYFLMENFGGMVFYGGLIGFCLGVLRYCAHFKVPLFDIADLYTPFLPFAHAFGRIGCFCAGCCYGVEYHGIFSVQFPYNEITPELSEVPRLPVQLIEAGLNFICFGVLLYIMMKNVRRKEEDRKIRKGQLLGFYLAYYLIIRTILEFFRGDSVRGSVGFLSTSQIISLLLIPVAIYFILAKKRDRIFAQKKL